MLLALALASESFSDQKASSVQPSVQPTAAASRPPLCDLTVTDKDALMRCWAHRMAEELPSQYLCNVSKMPAGGSARKHPALQGDNVNDFLLPPNTHLFLYGPSHVRSVFHVLVSAAQLLNRSVTLEYLSVSDDCDEQAAGLTGRAMEDSPESTSVCGIFQDDNTCKTGDLVRAVFGGSVRDQRNHINDGSSSITLVANHRQYLVPEHTDRLNTLLEAANPPFTHGYFAFPHLPAYFDAHCTFRKGGPPPDPSKIGDGAEAYCDIAKPTCMGSSPLYATIRSHIPNAAFLGGVALKHNYDVNSSCSRIHDYYKDLIVEQGPIHPDPEGRPVHVHACNAICKFEHRRGHGNIAPYADTHCIVGEGVAIAWEVLRSVGLLSCPSEWKSCDPLKFQPLWVLGANRNPSPNGANREAISHASSNEDCPAGERNADKDECTASTEEAVGQAMMTGPLHAINRVDTSEIPAGCSYDRRLKRPVFNHAGKKDRKGVSFKAKAVPGYPLVCTYTVDRPVGMIRDDMNMTRKLPSRPFQKGAAAAEIAAEIGQWRRNKPPPAIDPMHFTREAIDPSE